MSRRGSNKDPECGPPRWIEAIVRRRIAPGSSRSNLLGDLHQEYRDVRVRRGSFRANLWYLRSAIGLLVHYRGSGGFGMIERARDVRTATRALVRRPSFAFVVILTIAMGVGAGAAMYSIVDTVLLRPLPFPEPERLVRVWASNASLEQPNLDLTYGDIAPFRDDVSAFARAAGFSVAPRSLIDDEGAAESVDIGRISRGFLETLGIVPIFGNSLPIDDPSAVLISEGLWRRRYGSDPDVVGRPFSLDDRRYRVVGILSERHSYPAGVDVWRSLTPEEMEDDDREVHFIARLGPESTWIQADAEVRRVASRQAVEMPDTHGDLSAWAQPLQAMLVGDVRASLLTLLGAVGVLLLIACANAAALSLSRAFERSRDTALRMALGSSRGRIVSLQLTESLILAGAGGILGLLFGRFALHGILRVAPPIPREIEIALDLRVVVIMVAVSLLSGALFGLFPALRGSRGGSNPLHGGPRSTPRGRARGQRLLVTVELALSCVLVILGTLFFRAFQEASTFQRGFSPEGLTVMNVEPLSEPLGAEAITFFDLVSERVAALPEVDRVGFVSHAPMEQRGFRAAVLFPDADVSPPESNNAIATVRIATPDFTEAMGIPIVAGTGWSRAEGATPSFLVNERFVATRIRTGVDPIGVELELPWLSGRISGVIGDIRPSVGEPAEPMVYVPFHSLTVPGLWMVIRSTVHPDLLIPRVRDRIQELDPSTPLDQVFTMDAAIAETVASERFLTVLGSSFALLALLLAAVGVYGVTAFSVQSRRNEIGIRRALGAQSRRIAREIGGQVATITGLGLGVGIALALLAQPLIRSLVGEASANDPTVIAVVGTILVAVSAAAAFVPVSRAVRVDPTVALREE